MARANFSQRCRLVCFSAQSEQRVFPGTARFLQSWQIPSSLRRWRRAARLARTRSLLSSGVSLMPLDFRVAARFGFGASSISAGRLAEGVCRFLDWSGLAEPYSLCVMTGKSNSYSKVLPTAHVWGGTRFRLANRQHHPGLSPRVRGLTTPAHCARTVQLNAGRKRDFRRVCPLRDRGFCPSAVGTVIVVELRWEARWFAGATIEEAKLSHLWGHSFRLARELVIPAP